MDILNFILQRPVEGIVVFCVGLVAGFAAGFKLRRWWLEEKLKWLEVKVQLLEENEEAGDENEDRATENREEKKKQQITNGRETSSDKYGEKYWLEKYPDAVKCAAWYLDLLSRFYVIQEVRYVSIITIYIGGLVRVSVRWRKSENKALFHVRYKEGDVAEAVKYLESQGIPTVVTQTNLLVFTADQKQLKEKQSAHEWIAQRLCPQLKNVDR
jgi:hypothetical protein